MRRLPIDTSSFNFTIAEEPREVIDFESKQPKVVDGAALSSVKVLAQSSDEMSIITIKVAGLSSTFKVGESVRLIGLSAMPWVANGKDGISFSVDSIEVASKAKAA